MSSTAWFDTMMLFAEANAAAEEFRLTPSGWAVMVASISVVLLLVVYCTYRVLKLPPVEEESLKGPLEIDTGDTSDAD